MHCSFAYKPDVTSNFWPSKASLFSRKANISGSLSPAGTTSAMKHFAPPQPMLLKAKTLSHPGGPTCNVVQTTVGHACFCKRLPILTTSRPVECLIVCSSSAIAVGLLNVYLAYSEASIDSTHMASELCAISPVSIVYNSPLLHAGDGSSS